jgi:uncharacterized membrane protein YfcA
MFHDIIFFITGIIVGAMNAIAGGGMLLGYPIMFALGMPAIVANATANVAVLPGNIGATFGYRKFFKKVPRQYLVLIIPAIVGAAIGATLLRHTSMADFSRYIPWLILFAVILFAFQPFLYRQIHAHIHGPKRLREKLTPLAVVSVAVLPLSIYGGYFGAGLGFVMLAFLGFTRLRDHIHRMNALKCVITVVIASVSIICLASSKLIDWRIGLIMGSGSLIGGYCSALWTQKVSSHSLRIIVLIIGLSTAIYLAIHNH